MKKIYFDNAATTKVAKEVIQTMVDIMENSYANADSSHNFGIEISKKIKKEKEIFKSLLSLDPNCIYFTAGGGDSNNILLNSLAKAHKYGRIISTKIEHPSVLETLKELENIYDIQYVSVDKYGNINIDELKTLLNDETILVSISYINSEIGTIQDIAKISNMVKQYNKNIVFHTDFVQGLGHIDVNFSKLNVDAISFSSHKIYGPKGIGAFYLAKNVKFKKTIFGSNTENLLVPRTMPNELVMGFLCAMKLIDYIKLEKMYKLKEFTINKLKEIEDIHINTPENSSPSILNVAFKDARGEVILNYLSSKNIYVSTGSACSSKKGVSNVIQQIGLDSSYVDGVIRISFSLDNSEDEVIELVESIKEVLEMMR